MSPYDEMRSALSESPRRWLVSGAAGFIGSHLVEGLLGLGQEVVGLDDLSTGKKENLPQAADKFTFIEGDTRDEDVCLKACEGIDFILHHAAVASVVKSIEEPEMVRAVNVGGFRNILKAAEKTGVKRVVYASSSAVYGDGGAEPRKETHELQPKSPYADGKIKNEQDAQDSGLETIGLRYFNIYGPRQDPNGAYAAVIPKWVEAMGEGSDVCIFGDGETVRDFCHVSDVVQANVLAAMTQSDEVPGQVYNIGSGQATTLNELFSMIQDIKGGKSEPLYRGFREGDIRISCADITKAEGLFNFAPHMNLYEGLKNIVQFTKRAAAC